MIREIPHTHELLLTDKIPRTAGVYIVRPTPERDTEAVEDLLWRIWERERVGVFLDEGYMVPDRSAAFQAILTQGRSKRIPVMTLTQRPTWLTRFAFSEAEYIQYFSLTDTRDIKTVKQFMPLPIETRLPGPYYSWWYDNARNYNAILKPVPDKNTILDTFYDRLKPARSRL